MEPPDFAGFSPGWREGVLALIVLLAGYMLFELFRIRRLRRQKNRNERREGALEPGIPDASGDEAVRGREEEATAGEEEVAWSEPPAHLVQEAFMRGVESELGQMRDELDVLRGEFAALREELRQEIAQLHASQAVSPLYSDAMQMAVAGYGAEIIAERCGISRAESELVVSLVKNREH